MKLRGLMWWIDRWRKSTAYADLDLEHQGGFRNLLDEAFLRSGGIPNDERILAKACGDATAWPRLREILLARFTLKADGWHHDTIDEVRSQMEKRASRQQAYRDRRNARHNVGHNGGVTKAITRVRSGSGSGSEIFVRTDQQDPVLATPFPISPTTRRKITASKNLDAARGRSKTKSPTKNDR